MIRKIDGSFRDPSGFLFLKNKTLFRNIDKIYQKDYKKAFSSGLFELLWEQKLLIKHSEEKNIKKDESTYKIIKPEKIPFISHPYEWCFSQLKDAALLTLQIQKIALEKDMSLKDASAFNVQFFRGRPIFIDTLSFEEYKKGKPWVAYKQFCQHFLAPLSLMCYCDLRLNQLFKISLDGIPLDLTSSLLPQKTFLKSGILTHIHLHAKTQNFYSDKKGGSVKKLNISKNSLLALIDSLENTIKSLKPSKIKTEWANYYSETNYADSSFEQKKTLVEGFINDCKNTKVLWDMGGNTGVFSRIASNRGIFTLSFDIDPIAIEKSYILAKKQGETKILPLVLDLNNPSSGLGWDNLERDSIQKRANADIVMALALIHHLCISNNLPFEKVAQHFSKLGKYLIIEFVPKEDSNTQRLLATREDIFKNYNEKEFEKTFSKLYKINKKEKLEGSERTLYLMEKK